MPTYEFRCPSGHDFEKFYRTISGAEAQAACPECGVLAERILSPTSFAFKGSGFYLTDYGRNAHRDHGSAPKHAAAHAHADESGSPAPPHATSNGAGSDGAKGDSVKIGGEKSASASGSSAPAADSGPAAPKKSKGE